MTLIAPRGQAATPVEPTREVERYPMADRVVHWVVGVSFVYLLLSGMALAYPRMAWLANLLGGGPTMRAAHPWFGGVFSVGLLAMVFKWARGMRFERGDGEWLHRIRAYTRTGHN